jgi:hypothetical protein
MKGQQEISRTVRRKSFFSLCPLSLHSVITRNRPTQKATQNHTLLFFYGSVQHVPNCGRAEKEQIRKQILLYGFGRFAKPQQTIRRHRCRHSKGDGSAKKVNLRFFARDRSVGRRDATKRDAQSKIDIN